MEYKVTRNTWDFIKQVLSALWYYLKKLYEKFDSDQIWLLTSGVSFSIILVTIPAVLIIFTVLGIYLDKSDAMLKINEYINQIVPMSFEYKEKFLMTITERAEEISKHTVLTGLLGIAGVLWTMSGLFSYMRDAMNRIYNVKESLSFLKGKLRDFALLIIIVMLFLSSTAVTSFYHLSVEYLKNLPEIFSNSLVISIVLPISLSMLISFGLFYFLYSLVPHYKIPQKALLLSTLIACILFETMKFLFSYYVLNISNYKYIYGAYAAIVIVLLWIYVISLIFCVGAAIGQIYVEKNKLKIILNTKKNNGTEAAL